MNKPIFQIKKFEEPNLGSYLRGGRRKLKLSLGKVSQEISVSVRHIRALEKNDFSSLPPEVYVKGFLCRYCDLLGLSSAKALYFFDRNKLIPKKDSPSRSPIAHVWISRVISRHSLAVAVAILFLTASIFYLIKVVYPMYARPSFALSVPNACPFETYQEKIELRGTIQPESKIWINDEEAVVNKDGNFFCPVFLKEGENAVRFKIMNKFGKGRWEECTIWKN